MNPFRDFLLIDSRCMKFSHFLSISQDKSWMLLISHNAQSHTDQLDFSSTLRCGQQRHHGQREQADPEAGGGTGPHLQSDWIGFVTRLVLGQLDRSRDEWVRRRGAAFYTGAPHTKRKIWCHEQHWQDGKNEAAVVWEDQIQSLSIMPLYGHEDTPKRRQTDM